MQQHFFDSTSGNAALLYGSHGALTMKLTFWSRAMAVGLSPLPWLAVLPVLLILLALAWRVPQFVRQGFAAALREATLSGWFFAGASFGIVACTILGLASQIPEETRYLSDIYAPLGIATAWALT